MLTWVFFWFVVIVWIVCRVYFTFLAIVIPVILCIIVFTSLFTYVAIFVVARKKMLKRNKVHSNSDQESRRNFMAFLRELKMAKTYVMVVSLCFFCYLPNVLLFGIETTLTPDIVLLAFELGNTLISMNSTLNCLIFFWGNREMRKEGSKILKKCFHRQEHQQTELNVVQMRERQTKR